MNEEKVKWLGHAKEILDNVGPGMCMAKWMQVSLHLHNGHTHSCHHPNTHKIPLEEIQADPSALHNTSFKKEQRKIMMTGGRPPECNYCWNIEDNSPKDVYSDRILKSIESWAGLTYAPKVFEKGFTKSIDPSYLEVSFSSACNFKCSYCSPQTSSKWMEEIKEHGGYPTSSNYNNLDQVALQQKIPLLEREDNPYVDAFWKWWPTLYPELHTFRITGGEPLMSKHTFKVLDYIIDNPNPNLELSVNSNCGVEEKLFDKFLDKVKYILENKLVKKFTLYTSCEAYGSKAEYIRYGLDYQKWFQNCIRYLENIPTGNFFIMSAYNALSVTSYEKFLEDVLSIKTKYQTKNRAVKLDISYVNYPTWMNVNILPIEYKDYIDNQIKFMEINQYSFELWEIDKLKRILYLFNINQNTTNQKDFYLFFNEHDQRRKTNFLDTFPEMEKFYFQCQSIG